MIINSLQLQDYRSYKSLEVRWPEGVILLFGQNGAGKTNLIESIVVACTGHGLVPVQEKDLVRRGAPGYSILLTGTATNVSFILARRFVLPGSRDARCEGPFVPPGRPAPVVTFSPDDIYIVKGPPAARRRYLDEVAANTVAGYRRALLDFRRALQQRNELLHDVRRRLAPVDDLDPWDMQVARQAAWLHSRRLQVTRVLTTLAAGAYTRLAGAGHSLSVAYHPGIDAGPGTGISEDAGRGAESTPSVSALESTYYRAFVARRVDDLRLGLTAAGPHRDDLDLFIDGLPARTHASQGQQRAAALALRMAQSIMLEQAGREPPVICLDDVYSELDEARRGLVTEFLMSYPQVFVTATSREGLPQDIKKSLYYYLVEDGSVRQVPD